jgi:hypothetical protein
MPSGTSWNPRSGVFAWWGGQVTLPDGFKYEQEGGDTFVGQFTSSDGKVIIHHDIGGYAGAWARLRGAYAFEERVIEGARVWTAQRTWPTGPGTRDSILFAVTFPDNGCANFYLTSSNLKDAASIDRIARSFRPKTKSAASSFCESTRRYGSPASR